MGAIKRQMEKSEMRRRQYKKRKKMPPPKQAKRQRQKEGTFVREQRHGDLFLSAHSIGWFCTSKKTLKQTRVQAIQSPRPSSKVGSWWGESNTGFFWAETFSILHLLTPYGTKVERSKCRKVVPTANTCCSNSYPLASKPHLLNSGLISHTHTQKQPQELEICKRDPWLRS